MGMKKLSDLHLLIKALSHLPVLQYHHNMHLSAGSLYKLRDLDLSACYQYQSFKAHSRASITPAVSLGTCAHFS